MFTGIIEEQGSIKKIEQTSARSITLTIQADEVLIALKQGDSIAINGICLTVTEFTREHFTVDVMPETMRSTSLDTLKVDSKVNLERAMIANGRFGGHFVSGHVDSIGEVIHKQQQENAIYFDIKYPDEFSKWLITKGSVTVDGVSLTVFQIEKNVFTISLIPHTASVTILGDKVVGDVVNVEYDMIGKYVQHMLEPHQ